ncbi:MAG: hypothetical protein ACTSUQ_12860 [Candidatus Freyarchaeota archaeon]
MNKTPEEIEFETKKEVWNYYRLQDNSLLRAKSVLVKVIKTIDKNGKPNILVTTSNIFGVSSPKNLKGQPSTQKPTTLSEHIVDEDIDFKPEREEQWNEYTLQDGTILKTKLIPIKVSRTSFYDPAGDPIYIIEYETIVKTKTSPKTKYKN